MENMYELFVAGKYVAIIAKLNQEKPKNGVIEQLSWQNNLTVCENIQVQTHASSETKFCLQGFRDILLKCASIPAKESVLSVELAVLWNYLYIYVKHRQRDFTDQVSVHRLINRTMYRVCSRLPGYNKQKAALFEMNHNSNRTTHVLVNLCLESLKLGASFAGLEELVESLFDCFRMVSLLAASERNFTLACSLLHSLKQIEDGIITESDEKVVRVESKKNLCFALCLDHKYFFKESNANLTHFLLSCYQCSSGQWEEGIKGLDQIGMTEELKLASRIVSGYGLYKLNRYSEAVAVLMQIVRSSEIITQRLKARIFTLIGTCLEKMGSVQLSIQMHKEALTADFRFLNPLYQASLQYRKLAQTSEELECLNLLVTALEMREQNSAAEGQEGDEGIDLLNILPLYESDISYTKALYMFASRSLQLQRYTIAAEKYKQLLIYLQSWESEDFTGIPSLVQVHHEAILALLKANQLRDCLTLCNKVISSYHRRESLSDLSLTFSGNTPSSSIKASSLKESSTERLENTNCSRKRKREKSDSFEEDNSWIAEDNTYSEDVIACKYKAEVLFKLGQHDSAIASAQRAVDAITSFKRKLFEVKGETIYSHGQSQSASPANKRSRLDSEVQTTSNENLPSALEELKSPSKPLTLEFELYTLLSKILHHINQPTDSLHYKRLAEQIKSVELSIS